jgi:hypothetical protein
MIEAKLEEFKKHPIRNMRKDELKKYKKPPQSQFSYAEEIKQPQDS